MIDVYDGHHLETPYIKKNYKKALSERNRPVGAVFPVRGSCWSLHA